MESYDIRYSYNSSDILMDNFSQAQAVTTADLQPGSTLVPVPGLSTKTVSVTVQVEGLDDRMMFFAVTATDDKGLSSSVSNIAQVSCTFTASPHL